MKKLIGSLLVLPLLTAGVVVGASSAQAAAISPIPISPNSTYPFFPVIGGSLTVELKDINAIRDTVFFSFTPSAPTNNYNVSGATGSFSSFNSTSGSIKNFVLPFPVPPGTPLPKSIPAFLTMGPTSTFDLESISITFLPNGMSTIVSIGFEGQFQESSTSLHPAGKGVLSATFPGTPAEVITKAALPGGITVYYSGNANARTLAPTTSPPPWSASFTVSDPASVPEPSNIAGLVAFAGVSALLLKRG